MLTALGLAGLMFLSGVASLLLARFIWPHREQPGALPYVGMLGIIVVWTVAAGFNVLVSDQGLSEMLLTVAWLGAILVPVPWAFFALEYTGRGRHVTPKTVAAVCLPAVANVVGFLTNAWHGLVLQNVRFVEQAGTTTMAFEYGPWFLFATGYAYVLFGAGIVLLLEFSLSDSERYRQQTLALLFGGLMPAATSGKRLFELPPWPYLDLTPAMFAITAPVVGYALFQYELFRSTPAARRLGQAAAIDDFGDSVIVIDEEHRVVDANDRARRLLSNGTPSLTGEGIEELLGTSVDLDGEPDTLRLETNEGRRQFDLTISDVESRRQDHLGHTVVLHDVTADSLRRQRLEVLNRILRHNLRNSMTAVTGFARNATEHVDDEGEWMLDRIEAQATEVIDLSEKAREIDRVTDPSRSPTAFEVEAALDRVRDRLTDDHPDLTVTITVPGTLTMTTDRVVVEDILRYAVEGLLSAHDGDDPRIVLSATPTDTPRPWIDVTITTNGAGVPAEEREVIDRGSETPLEHSRDLDLWLVSWGVEALGGTLSFVTDRDRPGIRLSLPDFERLGDETDSPD